MNDVSYEDVFTYEHLYKSYKKCCKGVRWKSSTQKFIANAPLLVYRIYRDLKEGEFKSEGFYEFDLYERGKARHIKSVTFRERVVQKCLCDYALVPVLSKTLIYDNGACIKGKGYSFTVKRIKKHLAQHIRKYGTEGYILLFDFSRYFDTIDHNIVKRIIDKNFSNKKLKDITMYFVNQFDEGLGLGSQISQILSVTVANYLDHFIKEKLRVKRYGRYMDDGYLIHIDKEYLKYCLKEIEKVCIMLGITLNKNKTQIVKLLHGFTYIKIRYKFNKTKIIKLMNKKSVTRQRRRIKRLYKKGADIDISLASWYGYARQFNSYRTVKSMEDWRKNVLVNQTKFNCYRCG